MKKFIVIASFFGLVAVGLGAAGSHGFKEMLIENGNLETFNIAIDYMFIHTIMLLITAVLIKLFPERKFSLSGWMFTVAIIFFSVNMVVISLFEFKVFTFLNPIGGVLFMAGWINLGVQGLKIKESK